MKQIYIACTLLVLLNRGTCEDDYYGDDSGAYYGSADYKDTLYDTFNWPLNLEGSVRIRMALNGALADTGKNFVCSPVSALLPLGKLVIGATGKCQDQLLNAIGQTSVENAKSAFRNLLKDMRSVSGVKLTVCSRIYISKELKLSSEFEKNTKDIFKSSIKHVNLKEPGTVANKINNWVNQRTKGMVPDIIRANDISPDSSIILVNAVYFSGKWKHPFRPAEMQDFYTPMYTTNVPMMKKESEYRYLKSDTLDSQIIEIPYVGNQASFVIFLPNSKDGLPILLYKLKLAPELMQIALSQMKMQSVILSIPKFQTTMEIDLKVAYKKLGLTDIFETKDSGLTGIVEGKEEMSVSKAIQKAVIEVNEQGTRAAAASAMEVQKLALHLNQVVFNANRPFYYFIKVKKERLFTGIYTAVVIAVGSAPGSKPEPIIFNANHPFVYFINVKREPIFIGTYIE